MNETKKDSGNSDGFEEDSDEYRDMIPDRSLTNFYCGICDAHMYTSQTWKEHIIGKRHLKNVKKMPGEMPSKVRSLRTSRRAMLLDELQHVQEPVVGLGFMSELQRNHKYLSPSYTCYLCQANLTWSVVVPHILGTKHRLAYIKAVDREAHDRMVSLQLSKNNFDGLVEDQAEYFECQHGQGTMEVKVEKPKMFLYQPRQERIDLIPETQNPSTWIRSRRRSHSRSPFRHGSHKQSGHVSFDNYRIPESGSPSPRHYDRASFSYLKLPDIDNMSLVQRVKLLRELKTAYLIIKSDLCCEVNSTDA